MTSASTPRTATTSATDPPHRAQRARGHANRRHRFADNVALAVLSSIILVILVVTAVVASTTGRQPPWALQPATVTRRTGRVPKRGPGMGHSVSPTDEEQKRSVIDVLRFFGLARRAVPRPIVGRRAYVRWWERLRAAIVLSAIVIGLGFVLAAIIGIVVLGAGFLLEQAIS